MFLTPEIIMQPKHCSKTNQGNLIITAAFATCVTSDAAKYYADMVPGLDMELCFTATVDNAKDMLLDYTKPPVTRQTGTSTASGELEL
jgi:hypothetical protein